MLQIRDLHVQFGRFEAVRGISLEVQRGEIFGFLGPNGAGKTTTIRVLTGQIPPRAGSIRLAGHDLLRSFEKIKPLLGYVPDFDNHFEDFTADENMRLYAGLYGAEPGRVAEALQRVELIDERRVKVKNYSKGMKKKLTLAREMLHRPEIMLLDEPTANLDVHSKHSVRELLREIADSGRTIFLTTHDMEEAEEICDRMCVIDQGRVVEINTPHMFKSAHAENLVYAAYEEDGRERRVTLRMNDENDRRRLAELIQQGSLRAVHSKEFNFRQVFLKLTGRKFE